MADVRIWLNLVTAAWTAQGWVDSGGAALIAARQLAAGQTPDKVVAALPTVFYAANRCSKRAVSQELSRITAKAPLDSGHEASLLFVAAGPSDQHTLRLGAEHRDIMEGLRATTLRDRLTMNAILAARPIDLSNAFNRYQPTILHISAHGDKQLIVLEDDAGKTSVLNSALLSRLITNAGTQLQMVVLSACESVALAKALTKYVDVAIGMKQPIGDSAARVFAVQLYASLGEGVPLKRAFSQAALQIDLQGLGQGYVPQLFTRNSVNASQYNLLTR